MWHHAWKKADSGSWVHSLSLGPAVPSFISNVEQPEGEPFFIAGIRFSPVAGLLTFYRTRIVRMKLLLARFRSSPGKTLLSTSLVCLIVVVLCAAEKNEPAENDPQLKSLQEKFEKTRATIDKLQEENASLRLENQKLRRMVAETIESLSDSLPINPATQPNPRGSRATYESDDDQTNPAAMDEAALTHWLSTGGKRHNSNCRYFKKPAGQPCGPDDGIACTLCGG